MDLSRAEVLKSEMRRSVVSKLQFGSKHDAARYAAEQRWKGHVSKLTDEDRALIEGSRGKETFEMTMAELRAHMKQINDQKERFPDSFAHSDFTRSIMGMLMWREKNDNKQIMVKVNGKEEAVSFFTEKKPFDEVKMGDIVLNTKGQPAWVIRRGLVPRGLGMTEHTMTLAQAEFKRTRKGLVARMGHEFYERSHGALEVLNDKTVAEVTVLTPNEPLAKEFLLRKALYGGAF